MNGPFQTGQTVWPGLAKLVEECGEVGQVAGKLIAMGGAVDHWDGTNLRDRLTEELGDVIAAAQFVATANGLAVPVAYRARFKLTIFEDWHLEGLKNGEGSL